MLLLKWAFILFSIIGIIFIIFPEWDIAISRHFYEPNIGFIYAKDGWVEFIFRAIPILAKITSLGIGISLLGRCFINRDIAKTSKSPLLFLLIALILGPGLFVNSGLKENFGRARPREIVEFDGTKEFSRAGHYVSQCQTNCSFSSGHAAMGFYFTSFAWITSPQYQAIVFAGGFLLGAIVGLGRIMQGGHFFTDVIFSFLAIMLANELAFRIWKYICKKIPSRN